MDLNIINLLYLFFRLAPFIIVCYFSLSSIFNQDLKGLIYLVGLLMACFICILIGNSLPQSTYEGTGNFPVCKMITLGSDGSFSKTPLSVAILTYTLIYLTYIIAINHIELSNIPILVIFPLLIICDIIWNAKNNCYGLVPIAVSLVFGGFFGYIWALIIEKFKQPKLFFLNVGSDNVVCQRPSKQLFKCTFNLPSTSEETTK